MSLLRTSPVQLLPSSAFADWPLQDSAVNDPGGEVLPRSFSSMAQMDSGFVQTCANPECHTGWLHLLRNRAVPRFEGGWTCSASCMRIQIAAAVRREMEGWSAPQLPHRHRLPLGLTMLEQGWITAVQLREALRAQRQAGSGRLGYWLVQQEGIREELITRALGLQWSCPVLPLKFHDPELLTPLLPRLFVDAYGALPLRVSAGKLLYLGFEDRIDSALALSLARMTGLRVESGLVLGSLFAQAHTRTLNARFPPATLIDGYSENAIVRALAHAVEKARPIAARLVRVHDFLWLRMTLRGRRVGKTAPDSVQDVICSREAFQ